MTRRSPAQHARARVVDDIPYWFVIGGQAVRCFAPYRPSRDVDFGVDSPVNLDDLKDWSFVRDYFLVQVGSLLVPPMRPLAIQTQPVDVSGI